MDIKIQKLQKKINIKFKNLNLIKKAITHKSYDPENNFEKLEFLGDRILGLVISIKLIELYPNEKEGILDKKLASLVNRNKCLEIGKNIGLNQFIIVGKQFNKKIAKNVIVNKIISDCMEALIGAIYYEKGFKFTEKFILNCWKKYLDHSEKTFIDSKTKLQEYSLKFFKKLPSYKFISSSGPKHNLKFKMAVKLENTVFFEGIGESKKKAEQKAAQNLLKTLEL
jgi:ribonuclease-3|tara:strand:+ start:1055 stop:1729 length:675 start_codon:yes stop_codon:yes gene_type:complete